MNHPLLKQIITWIYGEAGAKHVTLGKLLKDVLFFVFLLVTVFWVLGIVWLA